MLNFAADNEAIAAARAAYRAAEAALDRVCDLDLDGGYASDEAADQARCAASAAVEETGKALVAAYDPSATSLVEAMWNYDVRNAQA